MREPEFEQPRSPSNFRQNRFKWIIVALLILLFIILLIFHHRPSKQHRGEISVVTSPVRSGDMPVYIPALGTVTPLASVTVRTQVSGRLLRVLYQEGQIVKAGDLLAEIDPRPFQAQLIQFQGQLAHDQALLANSRLDLKRFQGAFASGGVTKQQVDTQAATVLQNEGTVKLDLGQIAGVQVNLTYCEISSPTNGMVGLRLVDPGNFVQPSDTTGLVVVNTLSPITVVFSIPEDNLAQVMKPFGAGQSLMAKAYDRTQNNLLTTGVLLTTDNEIDPNTGTIKLKAQFENKHYELFPNQFVNIELLVDTLHNVNIIPTAAIQHGVNGTFVYLLNQDNTVSVRPVRVSITEGDNTAISSGLSVGQSVVTEGADKLSEGAKVKIATPNSSSAQNNNHTDWPKQTRINKRRHFTL